MTLILLHPLPMDGTIWPAELHDLDTEVVAPTMYGLGTSIEAWAAGVLDLAGPGPLAVVGNSVGGSCAIEVARLAPDRVRLLVLVGSKAGHRPEPDFRDEAVRVLTEEGLEVAWERYWAPLLAPDAAPGIVDRARRLALDQRVDDIVRGTLVFHSRPDRAAFLETVAAPVVVVRGEHDRIPRNGEALAASLVKGSYRVVPGAGHYLPLERPAALARIVREALGALEQSRG